MSSPFTQAHLKTPKGFEHLLEGLCKEVLRRQPEDILEYATQHFSRLMKLREETGYDGYTPKAEIELESQEAAVEETPVILEPEEPATEDPAAAGETQDDAPEAEQTAVASEESRPADEIAADEIAADEMTAENVTAENVTTENVTAEEITEEVKTADAGPESERQEKAEPVGSLPEAEASVDEATAASAEAGETGVPGDTKDTQPSTETQGTADNETVKEQLPDSGAVPVDPASTELPASDSD